MDPRVCLSQAEGAVNDGCISIAIDHLRDYTRWRDSGGFEPKIYGIGGDAFANNLRIRIARLI